ncbi:tripartite motif-containing protein 2-like [Physella acuta]|uniref:tripartite motif-containing protein 2-like n=1 Tax=Physella acuta TaxID=109671 RepID=UPI0027DD5F0C|nr:tripartite motif-containing protein 2-like [Physella acuta]
MAGIKTTDTRCSKDKFIDTVEEEILSCSICSEKFDQSEREPKTLPCNHIFCKHCLARMMCRKATKAAKCENTIVCPNCRKVCKIKSSVKELPTDHRAIQLMDLIAEASVVKVDQCPKHPTQSLYFFCECCQVPVCRDCTVLDHKETEGHRVRDVSETMKEYNPHFDALEKLNPSTIDKLNSWATEFRNTMFMMNGMEASLKSEISSTFDRYHTILDERKTTLVNQVSSLYNENRKKLEAKRAELFQAHSQLRVHHESFKTYRKNSDVLKMFESYREQREFWSKMAAVPHKPEVIRTCEFRATNMEEVVKFVGQLGVFVNKPDVEATTLHNLNIAEPVQVEHTQSEDETIEENKDDRKKKHNRKKKHFHLLYATYKL